MAVKVIVLALSKSGETTARNLAKKLNVPFHGRIERVSNADVYFSNSLEHIRDLFLARNTVIGVCASGILIRAVAPFLSDKKLDPAIISVAEDGSVVVPLLGGHYGANRLAKEISNIPVIGSMVFDKGPRGFFTMMGVSPENAANQIFDAGADIVATNCGNGSEKMVDLAKELMEYSKLPLMVVSNAGIPKLKNKKVIYDETPEYMCENFQKLLDVGVSILGGCCGTTFNHINKFSNLINENN